MRKVIIHASPSKKISFFPPIIFLSLWFCKSSPLGHQSLKPVFVSRVLSYSSPYQKVFPRDNTAVVFFLLLSFFLKKNKSGKNLYSLDLVSNNHRILFTDLSSSLGLVIIGTVVLVGVSVDATEQVATATVEPWKHKWQRSKPELL